MSSIIRRLVLLPSFLVLFTSFAIGATQTNSIVIKESYALALPPTAKNGVVYLHIKNTSDMPIKLLSAATDIAERVELHNAHHDHGMIKMQQIKEINIQENSNISMQPGGGIHIMLMHLKKPLTIGNNFSLTLNFSDDTSINTNVIVKKPD